MRALILFYLHVEPNNFDELAKYWFYIEELVKQQVLPMPEIPFALTNK